MRMWTVWVGSDVREVAIQPHTHFCQHSEINKAFDADWFAFSNSVFQHVWQLNWWLTNACRRCVRTCPRPYAHKGSIVGRQTVSWPLANLCGSDLECDTETAVCHTYTHAERQTRLDVVVQSRVVIIQHFTENGVISWCLHSWAHKRTLAKWYAWFTFFALV